MIDSAGKRMLLLLGAAGGEGEGALAAGQPVMDTSTSDNAKVGGWPPPSGLARATFITYNQCRHTLRW